MPTELLRDLRAQLDVVDEKIERTQAAQKSLRESTERQIQAWGDRIDEWRSERATLVANIKAESQRLRGTAKKPYAAPKLTAIAPDDPRAVALREGNDHGH
jgi:t-SNARE complex subunit (syntaxin)